MKKIIILLVLTNICAHGFSQVETTLPFMNRLHQSTYSNPAFIPEFPSSFSLPFLPNLGIGVSFHGINLNMITKNIDTAGGIDLEAVHKEINEDRITINADIDYEIFHVRFKTKKWFYGINLSQHTHISASLSKDFLGFFILGNSYYSGGSADFSTNSVSALAYNELGFSMTRKYKRWSFGGRAKLLDGTMIAYSDNSSFSASTPVKISDPIQLRLGGSLHTSGLPLFVDTVNGVKASESEQDFETSGLFGLKNMGLGLDLGTTYEINKKFKVAAAVCDWGYINWVNKTYNYHQNDKVIEFGGIAYNLSESDSANISVSDSLEFLIKGDVTRDKFSTSLPTRFVINGYYEINPKNILGVMVQGRYFANTRLMAYTANYLHKFKNMDFAINYSIIGKSYSNVGLGLMFRAGAFQFYFIQDNLLGFFQPDKLQVMNTRLGFNFAWGGAKAAKKTKSQ